MRSRSAVGVLLRFVLTCACLCCAVFLQTLFETLLAKGVFTKDELMVWRDDDDDMAAGRGRALGQLEEFFEGLTA